MGTYGPLKEADQIGEKSIGSTHSEVSKFSLVFLDKIFLLSFFQIPSVIFHCLYCGVYAVGFPG